MLRCNNLKTPMAVIDLSKKALVVQANQLVEARYRLSVEEQKIIRILVSQIQKNDTDFKEYDFRIKDLAEMLGMEHSNTYGVLRTITKRLLTRVLEFENPQTKTLIQASWLAGVKYEQGQGMVSLSFHPYLKPVLLQLQTYFTKYELGQVLQFKGQYTIRFFELKKCFLGKYEKEVTFTLKELWETLGLRKDEYKIFRDFRKKVLEPAKAELLEKTGEAFTWEILKQGRGAKIVGVKIIFDGKVEKKPIELEKEKKPQEEPKQLALVTNSELITPEVEAMAGLVGVGVSAKTAQVLAVEHGAEKVREKLEMLENSKDIKNPAGFVAKAIREDWHDAKAQEQKARLEKKAQEQITSNRKSEIKDLKRRYMETAREVVHHYYEGLPEEEKKKIQSEFTQTQTMFGKVRVSLGFDGGIFHAFIRRKFGHLVPSESEFVQKEGQYLSDEDWQLWQQV